MEDLIREYLSKLGRKGARKLVELYGPEKLRELRSRAGKKGGRSRAAKFDQKTLSKWAKLGGRPRKKKGAGKS